MGPPHNDCPKHPFTQTDTGLDVYSTISSPGRPNGQTQYLIMRRKLRGSFLRPWRRCKFLFLRGRRTLEVLIGCCLKGFGWRMSKTLVRCRLKGFGAEHVQNPCRVLLKGLRKWAQPPYDQKVFKTDRFRHDFLMVLHRYQLLEISRNREKSRTFKLIVRCCLKGFGAEHVQNPRGVLLKGIRGGVCSKPS